MSESIEDMLKNKVIAFILVAALSFGGGNMAIVSASDDKAEKIDSLTKEMEKVNGRINLVQEVVNRVERDAKERDKERKEQLRLVQKNQDDLKYLILKIKR